MAQARGTSEARTARLLERLATGERLEPDESGYRIGRARASAALVAQLRRAELIEAAGGGYRLSGPGQAWLARRAAAEAGGDGTHAQNRLLARQQRRVAGVDRLVTVNLAESPLGWLLRHKRIDARQFEAGERLRGDFETARLGPRVTMGWDMLAPSRQPRGAPEVLDPTLAQLAARRRFDAALAALGPGLGDVLWRVACAGEGLDQAERALGWPARAGKVVLGLALDRLADHYGLA
ncbi:DUF6456 domain-containing protein [Parapedomonas caeni]